MIQSNVPIVCWCDCLKITAFTMNNTHFPILGNKSPYEILFHKIPKFASYRVFGSLCYATLYLHIGITYISFYA